MTYSDTITLMMTFFILLLTFATAEPEKFEQIQSAVFTFGGRNGVAGKNRSGIDRDAISLRYRPASGRLTNQGSEMPPLHSDPVQVAVAQGLTALQVESDLAREQQFEFDISAPLFIGTDGKPTAVARQQLGMLARQMQRIPLSARLEVTDPADLPAAVEMVSSLSDLFQIHSGRLSVSVAPADTAQTRNLRLVITRRNSPFPMQEPKATPASREGEEGSLPK